VFIEVIRDNYIKTPTVIKGKMWLNDSSVIMSWLSKWKTICELLKNKCD